MNVKNAVSGIQRKHPMESLTPLFTPWGENIIKTGTQAVWQEYPRPQLTRDNYKILNGQWSCWIANVNDPNPLPLKSEILVPFSPESLLGDGASVMTTALCHEERPLSQEAPFVLSDQEYLWYERDLIFSREEQDRKANSMRCILHFDAVDQEATVFCNGKELLTHRGGYLPFHTDITEFVSDSPALLQVRVRDYTDSKDTARGKQSLERGGIFYTAQSGIWQSVWYEWVPLNYIEDLKITPDPDNGSVKIELTSEKDFSSVSCTVYKPIDYWAAYKQNPTVSSFPGERTIALIGVSLKRESTSPNCLHLTLPADSISIWSPETPYLYSFTIMADNDIVRGYFALRSFSIEPDENQIPRFCLNHKPYFLHGVLDQGYWSDGLMTAPCDEALISDIIMVKNLGFNMIRKHLKIEPLRWYYHCDRLGLIVWQDMINGGGKYHFPWVTYLPTLFPGLTFTKDNHDKLLSRTDQQAKEEWKQDLCGMIDHLYNIPSIAVWVPFNEGWGQFDSAVIADIVKEKDPTRLVDHASGWFDQGAGDFKSVHNYFRKLKVKPDSKRAFVLSEYGGYACRIKDHSASERTFGYQNFNTPEELNESFWQLLKKQLFPLEEKGLSGAIYTQLSDIEEEANGLITYDRRVQKITLPKEDAE